MSRLSEKVAIVTGASKGIGAGIATAMGAAGARVAVNYSSDREGAERVLQAITDNGGKAIAVGAEVSGGRQNPGLRLGPHRDAGFPERTTPSSHGSCIPAQLLPR
jgi:NAD(P)-dependent dehydrogenase (short-subunit alcohol dehydrogenase family)